MEKIIKYPRTRHLEGSKLQFGDEDLSQIKFETIKNKKIIVEEKVDGANVGISFVSDKLYLQSRGHFLVGGYNERHYNLLKAWANQNLNALYNALGNRYIMFGEWLYAKHKIFYDDLPDYFLEFDLFDKENQVFLDTTSRKEITKNLPVFSVPVLAEDSFSNLKSLLSLLTNSTYRTEKHLENLIGQIERLGLNVQQILKESDLSPLMEGLYIKVEENGVVKERMKYVRPSFTQLEESQTRWIDRPIITNLLIK